MPRLLPRWCHCLALIFSLLNSTLAADFHLSPTGHDSANGSHSHPWQNFAHAIKHLQAGDTLHIMAGTYSEQLILRGKQGRADAPIVIQNHEQAHAVIDGGNLNQPATGRSALLLIENCDYITIKGLTLENYHTSSAKHIPVGILIEGSGRGIQIIDCQVHNIWQNSTKAQANGFGIAVYGTAHQPIDQLVLQGNTLHNLRTGQSESLVLNGNVTNFRVIKNHIYDCNNIGIDFIGYEGSAPAEVDRARNGLCSENRIHAINSANNPGYEGKFQAGGGDASAAGIYVDGGTQIVIERNVVYDCNFGIELASEHRSGLTDYISIRNNLIHHNHGPGIIMGGYDAKRGRTQFCRIANNTLYHNDTALNYGGQIALQFYLSHNSFINNIIWANPATQQMIIHYVTGGTPEQRRFDTASNHFDYNLYYSEGAASEIEFGLNLNGRGREAGNRSYQGLAKWRAHCGSDAHSIFGDPGFTDAIPSAKPADNDFKLSHNSIARNRGAPSYADTSLSGALDFFAGPRITQQGIDIGMHEYHEWLRHLFYLF